MATIAGAPAADFVNPDFSPYTLPEFKGTWIVITSHNVEYFTAFANNDGGLIINDSAHYQVTWQYLCTNQIMETINHTWNPWETMSSRIAGKLKEFSQTVTDITAIRNAFVGLSWRFDIGPAFKNLTSSQTLAKNKVDTPMVYEDSERREYILEFNLTASDSDQAEEMMFGVRTMEAYSLPTKPGIDGSNLGLPRVFTIRSYPRVNDISPLIDIEYAAITSIQPTYLAPYDENGWPMRIQLTVTFKEMPPIYEESIDINM